MFPFETLEPGLYGIVGGAGSGKSTLAQSLKENYGFVVYSIDEQFIGDSAYRKDLLQRKQEISFDSLKDACNQFSWWDWDKIYRDVIRLPKNKVCVIEGAILGPKILLNLIRKIFLYHEESQTRLLRLVKRDGHKRQTTEICSRFLITEYAESLYYSRVLPSVEDKVVVLRKGTIAEHNFIPVEV